MSFASKMDKETPQTVWEEQKALGGRIMLTIPFGSREDRMAGFVSALGTVGHSDAPFPVITFCIEKPSGGCIVSTIVFPSNDLYLDFVDKLHSDAYSSFARSIALIEN